MFKKYKIKKLRKQLGGDVTWKNLFDRYEFRKKLGEGSFGMTYLVYDKLEQKEQVAKVSSINKENYETYVKELDNLIEI